MLRRAGTIALTAALFCVAASAPAAGRSQRKIERYIGYLESPEREVWQKPDQVVSALGVSPGQTVIDLGAGSGYFARRLARAVGPAGKVDAADVDPDMIAFLRRSLAEQGITNVAPRRVEANDPSLGPGTTDLVFLCNTYHHLENRVAYLRKIAPALEPGGRVVVIDFHKRDDIVEGPPFEQKIGRETVIEELRQAGFEVTREHSFLPYQYFLEFQPARVYSFDALARAVSAVMSSAAPERQKQWDVAALLSDYLQHGRLEEKFRRPNPHLPVTTYLLYVDPGGAFSIAALVFQPHARTTIHDHQSWVVWGTYSGKERETRFRRKDFPSESFPELSAVWSRDFSAGEVSFIDPPPGDIHDVENVDDRVSISLHVHATDISKQERNSYDIKTKTVRSFVQSYEPAR